MKHINVKRSVPATAQYGVFVWRGDARYKIADAIKVYNREFAAQRFCDLHAADNLVVRNLALISDSGARAVSDRPSRSNTK